MLSSCAQSSIIAMVEGICSKGNVDQYNDIFARLGKPMQDCFDISQERIDQLNTWMTNIEPKLDGSNATKPSSNPLESQLPFCNGLTQEPCFPNLSWMSYVLMALALWVGLLIYINSFNSIKRRKNTVLQSPNFTWMDPHLVSFNGCKRTTKSLLNRIFYTLYKLILAISIWGSTSGPLQTDPTSFSNRLPIKILSNQISVLPTNALLSCFLSNLNHTSNVRFKFFNQST